MLVAVVLSAWTPDALAASPYVVYVANNSTRGAVVLRSDPATGSLVEISRNGSQGMLFQNPYDIAVEKDGDLVVADMGVRNEKDGAVIRVNPFTGKQSLVSSGSLFYDPAGITVAPDGTLYVIDSFPGPDGGAVVRVDPHTGAQQLVSSDFNPPGLFDLSFGIAMDHDGSLVVVNRSLGGTLPAPCGLAGSLLRVGTGGGQSPVAGLLGLPNTYLRYPVGVAVDSDGTLVVANECGGGAGLVRIGPGGVQTPITSNSSSDTLRTPERVGITPDRDILVTDYSGGPDLDGSIVKVTPAGAQSTLASGLIFNHPVGIAVVPNRLPLAALTVAPGVVATGNRVKLDATGSRDPEGLKLVYEWDLDGNGTFETGSGTTGTATPRFSRDGVRTLRVRVTDPAGGRSVGTARLVVDGTTPMLTRLRSSGRTLKLGRSLKIDFRLSEAATVKLTVSKARAGRRVGSACRRAAKTGRRCRLLVQTRTLRRAGHRGQNVLRLRSRGLKPGHFKLSLRAVDEVGHRSPTRSLWLRVVK